MSEAAPTEGAAAATGGSGARRAVVDALAAVLGPVRRAGQGLLWNPVTIKELRSTFRSPRFVAALSIAMALVALVLVITDLSFSGSDLSGQGEVGRIIFTFFIWALFVVSSLVFPALACTRITDEHQNKSWELLATTSLRPWQIVAGKMVATLVLCAIFLLAAAPLVTVSFLVGGVAPSEIAWVLAALFLYGVSLTSHAMFVSSASKSTTRAVIGTYFSVGLLAFAYAAIAFFFLCGAVGGFVDIFDGWYRVEYFPRPVGWLVMGGTLGLALLIASYFLVAATNRVKPDVANKSTNLRVLFAVTLLLALGLFALVTGRMSIPPPATIPVIWGGLCVSLIILALGAITFGGELPTSSPRLRRRLTRIEERFALGPIRPGAVLRLLWPGGLSGSLYVLLLGAATILAIPAIVGMSNPLATFYGGPRADGLVTAATAGLLLILFLGQLTHALTLVLRHETAARILGFVFQVVLVAVPAILYHLGRNTGDPASLAGGAWLSPYVIFGQLMGGLELGAGDVVLPGWGSGPADGILLAKVGVVFYAAATLGLLVFNVAVGESVVRDARPDWAEEGGPEGGEEASG